MNGLRTAFVIAGIADLVLALGYVTRQEWPRIATWPWPDDSALTYAFVGAIIAAIGAAAIWMGGTGEFGSVPAGALNLTVTLGGAAGYLAHTAGEPERDTLPYAVAAGVLALGNLVLFLMTAARRRQDPRAMPAGVRIAFVGFTAILLVVGLALLLGAGHVMPWPVRSDSAVLIGWIFLGDACYFAYAVLRPSADGYRAQLCSFLAYDLVLLPPLLMRAPSLPGELRTMAMASTDTPSGLMTATFSMSRKSKAR